MSEAVVHLYSNETYDEAEFWCEPGETARTPFVDGKLIKPTRAPREATCKRCLSAAASYGEEAMVRLKELP